MEGRDVWGIKKEQEVVSSEDRNSALIFVSNVRPHMVLVVAYIQRILAVTRDPASQTDIILAALFWVLFNPVSLKFKGHLQGAAN